MPAARYFLAGGTLPQTARSYVRRHADEELAAALERNEFCYVLTARQMGKSSLMVRAAGSLRNAGVAVVVLDLSGMGRNVTPEQWYRGMADAVGRQLDAEDEVEAGWREGAALAPVRRFFTILRERAVCSGGRVVVFVDEVDCVRMLPFPADEFLTSIRECHNAPAHDSSAPRLTFCLLGVATPSDLIRDPRGTPFNVGRRIELTDFTEAEVTPLATALLEEAGLPSAWTVAVARRLLYWTGGHPYLTQRLCQAALERLEGVESSGGLLPAVALSAVNQACRVLFLDCAARRWDENLLFVRDVLLVGHSDPAALLDLYCRVLRGRRIPDDAADARIERLRLAGVTREEHGLLQPRNRIYQQLFGLPWVRANMPSAEVTRQRAAFLRGAAGASLVAGLFLGVFGSLAASASNSEGRARATASSLQSTLVRQDRLVRQLESALTTAREQTTRARKAETGERAQRLAADIAGGRAQEQEAATRRQAALAISRGREAQSHARDAEQKGELAARMAERSQEREVRLVLSAGFRHEAEGDPLTALLHYTQALRLDPRHAGVHRRRIAAARRVAPQLMGQWRAGSSVERFSLSPAGTRFAAVTPGGVELFDLDPLSSSVVGHPRRLEHPGPVVGIAFAHDERSLLTLSQDGRLRHWREGRVAAERVVGTTGRALALTSDGKVVVALTETGLTVCGVADLNPVLRIAFPGGGGPLTLSHAGDRVAARKGLDLWVFDLRSGKPLAAALRHGDSITAASFSGDGRLAITGCRDGRVRVWDLAGKEPHLPVHSLAHPAPVVSARLTEDEIRLVTACADRRTRVWDARSGQILSTSPAASGAVSGLVLGDKDDRAFTLGTDGAITVLGIRTGRIHATLWHPGAVCAAAPLPGSRLLTAGTDGLVRLWSLIPLEVAAPPRSPTHFADAAALSPDGGRIVTANAARRLQVWSHSGKKSRDLPLPVNCTAVASSDTGKLAAMGTDRRLRAWDAGGRLILDTESLPGEVRRLEFVGRTLVAVTDWTAVWDLERQPRRIAAAFSGVVDLHPRAPGLAMNHEGRIDRFPPERGSPFPLVTASPPSFLRFAPSGTRFVALSQAIEIRRATDGGLLRRMPLHDRGLRAVFSPDDRFLAVVSGPGTVRVWDLATGIPRTRPIPCDAVQVALNGDATLLVTGDAAGSVRVWSTVTGEPVGPACPGTGAVQTLRWDGDRITILRQPGSVQRWDLAPDSRPFTAIDRDVTSLVARRLDATGSVAPLPLAQIANPTHVRVAPVNLAWEAARAEECEQVRDWAGAARHLDTLVAAQPAVDGYRIRRARAAAEPGDFQTAREQFELLKRSGRQDRILYYRLALTYLALEDRTAYEQLCLEALAHGSATERAADLDMAAWICALGTLPSELCETALRVEDRLLQSDPDNPNYLSTKAWLLIRLGRPVEAKTALLRVVALRGDGGNGTDLLGLARSATAAGDLAGAAEYLSRADAWLERRSFSRPLISLLEWEDRVELGLMLRELRSNTGISSPP